MRFLHLAREWILLAAVLLVVGSFAWLVFAPPGRGKLTLWTMMFFWVLRFTGLLVMTVLALRVVQEEPRRRWVTLGAALVSICGCGYILLMIRKLGYTVLGEEWWSAFFFRPPDLAGDLATSVVGLIGAVGVCIVLYQYRSRIPHRISRKRGSDDSWMIPLGPKR